MSKKEGEEERWMKERAKKETGAPALAKLYSKQERGRKERLRQVKSTLAGKMGDSPKKKARKPTQSDAKKKMRRKKPPSEKRPWNDGFHLSSPLTSPKKGSPDAADPSMKLDHGGKQRQRKKDPKIATALVDNPLGEYLTKFRESWEKEDVKGLAKEKSPRNRKDTNKRTSDPLALALGFSPDNSSPSQQKQKQFFSPGELSARDLKDELEQAAGPAAKEERQPRRSRMAQPPLAPEDQSEPSVLARYRSAFDVSSSALEMVGDPYTELKAVHRKSKGKMQDKDRGHPPPADEVQVSARRKPRAHQSAPIRGSGGRQRHNQRKDSLPDIKQDLKDKNLGQVYREKRQAVRREIGKPKNFLAKKAVDPSPYGSPRRGRVKLSRNSQRRAKEGFGYKQQEQSRERERSGFEAGEGDPSPAKVRTPAEGPAEPAAGARDSPLRFPMKPRHSRRSTPAEDSPRQRRRVSGVAARARKPKTVEEEQELQREKIDLQRAAAAATTWKGQRPTPN